jgi:hypothetical protein
MLGQAPQVQLPPQLAKIPTQEAVESLLRDNVLRKFIIDIEPDSTILGDQQVDQQRRMEFIKATGTFLAQLMPVCQTQPKLVPYLGHLLNFGVKGFPVARDLITETENMVQQMQEEVSKAEELKQSTPPMPNPEQMKLEATKVKAQAEVQSSQAQIQMQQIQAQSDVQIAKMKMEQTLLEHQHAMEKMQMDHALTKVKHDQEMSLQARKAELEQMKHNQMLSGVINQLPDNNILHAQPPIDETALDAAMHNHLDNVLQNHVTNQNV